MVVDEPHESPLKTRSSYYLRAAPRVLGVEALALLIALRGFFAFQQRQTQQLAGSDGTWGIPYGSAQDRQRRAVGCHA
jgi:hypothetical protein